MEEDIATDDSNCFTSSLDKDTKESVELLVKKDKKNQAFTSSMTATHVTSPTRPPPSILIIVEEGKVVFVNNQQDVENTLITV